ncbi:unnamed protein product [Effrenium voratum]|nr:unnamed protein product [Effrenium voratum]
MELSLHRFCRVAAGGAHSLVVTERLEVLAWGSNSHGQVGNGSLEDVLNPTTVVEPGRAQYVFAGRNFSLMIDVDGALFAWGCNEDQILGLGTGNLKQQTPAPLNLARRIKHAAGGWKHILAVTEDGDLLSWGSNDYGQLGDGTKARRSAAQATPLPQARRAVAVACGAYHSLVLTDAGEVLAAGMGYSNDTQSFVQVIRMGVCMICAGTSHNLAITKTGTVLAWGANDHGQIGNGLLDFQPGPCAVQRSQLIIAAGGAHSLCASDAFQARRLGTV